MKNKYQDDWRKLLAFYEEALRKHSFPKTARIKAFGEDDADDERWVKIFFRYTASPDEQISLKDCQESVRFFRAVAKEEKAVLRTLSFKVRPVAVPKSEHDSFEQEDRVCLVPRHAFSRRLLKKRRGLLARIENLKRADDEVERAYKTFSEHGILYSLPAFRRLLAVRALYRRVSPRTLRRDIHDFEKRAAKELGLVLSSFNLLW